LAFQVYVALPMRRFLALFYLVLCVAAGALAQPTFTVYSIIDNPPITGSGDTIQSGFVVGELSSPSISMSGLYRSELIIQLPPLPPNSKLSSASLSLYLSYNSGTNGNASFGPISVYHNYAHNSLTFNSLDYSDPGFVLVTNSFIRPDSPSGQYYSLDVTAQLAEDYAHDGSAPFAAFRLQVDGLQYQASDHYYEFYYWSYPDQLTLQFTQLPPPTLTYGVNSSDHSLTLTWPAGASNFVLECADSLNATNWTAITNTYILNGQIGTIAPRSEPQQFFRLRQE
jgi:hypothetical protein